MCIRDRTQTCSYVTGIKPTSSTSSLTTCDLVSQQVHDPRPWLSNYTDAFDAVLADAGIRTVLCNVRTPRMNAIAERWIGGCRRELLDRTLIWNQVHLRRILRRYETHHNRHRPHRALNAAAPLKPLPEPVDLDLYRIRRQAQVGGMINEYRLVA